MPVAVMGGGEGPVEAFFAPAGLDPTILGDLPRIVQGNEGIVIHRPVDGKGCHY